VRTRPLLKRGRRAKAYARDGFVVVPLLSPAEVRMLREEHERVVGDVPAGFASVMLLTDTQARARAHDVVSGVLTPHCRRLLPDHDAFLCSYVTKSGPGSELLPHQDWPLVDERRWPPTLRVWCALEDVDESRGTLFVAPGSHRLPFLWRAENLESAVRLDEPTSAPMTPLRLRAGEAVVHDGRLVHSSPALDEGEVRLAVSAALTPRGAPILHTHSPDGEVVDLYHVPREFFFEHRMGGPLEPSAIPVGTVAPDNPVIGPDELRALIDSPG
jgi:hypothetical protein